MSLSIHPTLYAMAYHKYTPTKRKHPRHPRGTIVPQKTILPDHVVYSLIPDITVEEIQAIKQEAYTHNVVVYREEEKRGLWSYRIEYYDKDLSWVTGDDWLSDDAPKPYRTHIFYYADIEQWADFSSCYWISNPWLSPDTYGFRHWWNAMAQLPYVSLPQMPPFLRGEERFIWAIIQSQRYDFVLKEELLSWLKTLDRFWGKPGNVVFSRAIDVFLWVYPEFYEEVRSICGFWVKMPETCPYANFIGVDPVLKLRRPACLINKPIVA